MPILNLDHNTRLADITRAQALTYGGAPAVICGDRVISYAELDTRANRVANQLIALGVAPQERIAILAKNSDYFYELLFGCAKSRTALAPINFRLAVPEMGAIIKDAGARVLFATADFFDAAEKINAQLGGGLKLFSLDGPRDGMTDYAAWRDAGAAVDPRLPEQPDDDVIQLYTSGTTGLPKGVQLTNHSYHQFLSCAAHVGGFRYETGEAVLNAMPLFHVAGVNVGLAGLAQGCRVVVLKDLIPAVTLQTIAEHKINHAFFAPAIILMLMQAPELATADLTSMKTVSYGASPISEDLLKRAQARFNCNFLQFYGMTETSGAGTYLPPEAHDPAKNKLRSCGIPWPGVEVKLVNGKGEAVPVGEVGEVVIRGGLNMKGYWNRPDATAEALRGGWMHTGDAAYQDADGYFYIYDRVKDMIVTGGENVYPAEVENAIFGHPDVADVAVIGVPDEKWGEAVKAIVVAKPGVTVDPSSVISYARERVAGYKTPKSVDVVEAIPRNPTGKVLRRELRKPYWEGRDRQVS
jgi:acyl-CoA synthetase (AMP-forming)/AMP-acid ligase II